jgi:hypothetical protein
MKFAIVLIIAVVSGLIYRTVSSSQQQAGTVNLTVPPQWKEWLKKFEWKYLGWGVFGYVVWDLFGKFVSPRVPVEWKEWMPSFSWNTFEILVLVVGVAVLLGKWKKKTEAVNAAGGGGTGNNPPAPPKARAVSGDNYLAEKMVVALVLVIGFFFFWGTIPYQEIPPIPKDGMLYVPIFGILKASMIAGFIAILWSFFCETQSTNGAVFAVFLILAGLIVFFLGIKGYWFAPIDRDPLVSTEWVLGGVCAALLLVHVVTKNIEYGTIALLAVITIWLPQLASKSSGFMQFVHHVFQ